MLRLAAASGTLLCALLAGCDITTNDNSLVWLKPEEAVAKLNAPPGVFQKPTKGVWVDPRSRKSFEEDHIEGAINLPFPEMNEAAGAFLAGYDLFIVYGTGYTDTMAVAGSKRLLELGFTEVYTLDGGLQAWTNAGYDTVKSKAKPPAGGTPAATGR